MPAEVRCPEQLVSTGCAHKGVECVTVAHGAGEVPVEVDHASMEEAASFTYLEAPVVQAVEPAMGLTSGGALPCCSSKSK